MRNWNWIRTERDSIQSKYRIIKSRFDPKLIWSEPINNPNRLTESAGPVRIQLYKALACCCVIHRYRGVPNTRLNHVAMLTDDDEQREPLVFPRASMSLLSYTNYNHYNHVYVFSVLSLRQIWYMHSQPILATLSKTGCFPSLQLCIFE